MRNTQQRLIDETLVNEVGASNRIIYRYQDGEIFFYYDDGQIDNKVDAIVIGPESYEKWKFERLGSILKQIGDYV